MRILLQFPEGLKDKALLHAKKLEEQGNEIFISASPTFGACDLAIDEAKSINADKLVHFGHAEFHHVDFNVEYVPYTIDASLDVLDKSIDFLKDYKTIGIVTTIQHMHQLSTIREFYEKNGKIAVIGKPYGFAKKEGQILGCDVGSSATIDNKVDAHVYFGGGIFHPFGALIHTKKPFIMVDPFTNSVELIDQYREKMRKRSIGKIAASLSANRFGILVSTKNGQMNMGLANIIKNKIEKEGFQAAILVSNNVDFDSLNNMMEFDAFVNTACPRIAVDDLDRTRKPILNASELMESLKMRNENKRI